ncbi:hypothetical protein C8Q70DRAFT_963360 [Cubamyces menziesii]|nr:hypothetical protein C8Q70DRAFT_963360 [Cubamyces menziesii]
MGYAQMVFERQPRTHLFMLFVIGRQFRVLRWDRSGVVVTPLIDYVLHPDLLYDFLWRIGRASMAQLGLDPTAKLIKPGSDEYKKMDELAKEVATDLVAKRRVVVPHGDENNVFAYVREKFNESLEEDWPRWKLSVPQKDGSMRYFLVGKPTFTTSSLVGRATQGYVAVDPLAKEPKKQLVWLKDAWRTFYNLVEAEGDVLEQLKKDGVPFIPTVVCHGDLPGQATVTPDIWDKNQKALEEELKRAAEKKLKRTTRKKQKQKRVARTTAVGVPAVAPAASAGAAVPASAASGTKRRRDEVDDEQALLPPPHGVEGSKADDVDDKCPLRRHRHYRIVVEEVGLPLEQFENGFHLVSVIHDCIIAHKHAAQAGVLHRDISGGNILIYPQIAEDPKSPGRQIVTMCGLLTDWELSKDIKVKGRARRARQPERTGTWQYMSIALINEPTKAVEISDELEAFFHVLLYYAVRYLKSNCTDVPAYMERYFEAYRICDGRYRCGSLKTFTIAEGELRISETEPNIILFNTAVDNVLCTILGWLKAYYDIHGNEYIRVIKVDNPPDEDTDSDDESGYARKTTYYDESLVADDEVDAPRRPAPKVYSEKNFKDARKICLHDHILALLSWCMEKDPRAKLPPGIRWPRTDKVPDRYPDDSQKQLKEVPSGALGTHDDNDSNKRLKSNSGAAVPVQHPPPQTPPRKSYHSSIGIVDSGFASGSRPAAGSCPP